MAEADSETDALVANGEPARRRVWLRVLLVALAILVVALAAVWLSRDRIANNVIAAQLRKYDIPATYKIAHIGPDKQVLTDIVVGNPARPDLTVERAEVRIKYRLGFPAIGRVTVIRPRLYGTLRGGTLSFGTLDKVIFAPSTKAPGLPNIDLAIEDGRALIESDYGPIGIKAQGAGRLDGGFAGILAVAAPTLSAAGCKANGASLYGKLTTASGKPRIAGPLRLAALDCPRQRMTLRNAAIAVDASADANLKGFEGTGKLAAGALGYGGVGANGLDGTLRAAWRDGGLTARYSLAARGLSTSQAQVALLTAEGSLRARRNFETAELQTSLEGGGVRVGSGLDGALGSAIAGVDGTLLAPILERIRGALLREERGSAFSADLTARRTGQLTSIVVPQASLRGGSGATLLALSQAQISVGADGTPRIVGNIATGGEGLPRIVGRMERSPNGPLALRLRMADYAAGTSHLAIPEMSLVQAPDGAIGFAGRVLASGPLPGGSTQGLLLPVSGRWADGSLTLWRKCTDVVFDRLAVASLTLERRGLRLCPAAGKAIVSYGPGGLRIAAGAPSLDLAGRLGQTPIRLRTGAVGFAYPGVLAARQIDISLGPVATASAFRISNLTANFDRDIAGKFDGADVRLAAVPLNLVDASGTWRYADGKLTLDHGDFRLEDRSPDPRFNPLIAQGGTLSLYDNVIKADALLREPRTGREVTTVAIVHSLASGAGHADLAVPGLVFDDALQPEQLTKRALGVVANVKGTVVGSGRIDWTAAGMTSHGRFSSDSLDFAAAFGPVKGASGTVEFTDLLGLTTAPDQHIHIASVNPGIEVTDGEVAFSLKGGQLLAVQSGTWPFMGGTLALHQVALNLGVSEERRYEFEITGLDSAQFVARMDLSNISATGIFDGIIPIVFDTSGNGKIVGGHLASRPPGGNVSYVGELTYKDLSPIANFAFDALKSLDYTQMNIAMDGSLTGEIVTKVSFDGVKQGAGAKRNFITRRFENLPLRFNINIRAPFYQLITSIKAMYDPASVRDPRSLGLLSDDGKRLKSVVSPPPPAIKPGDLVPDNPSSQPPVQPIQDNESESMP
jgi:hypothetical protein